MFQMEDQGRVERVCFIWEVDMLLCQRESSVPSLKRFSPWRNDSVFFPTSTKKPLKNKSSEFILLRSPKTIKCSNTTSLGIEIGVPQKVIPNRQINGNHRFTAASLQSWTNSTRNTSKRLYLSVVRTTRRFLFIVWQKCGTNYSQTMQGEKIQR